MKRLLCVILTLSIAFSLFSIMPIDARAEAMSSSDDLIGVLKKMEGFSKYPYYDVSQWTVGYGTRCPDDKLEEYKNYGITVEEAEDLLADMLTGFESDVNNFANKYDLTFTQNQFDALVCYTYNCGGGWTTKESSTIHQAVRDGKTGSEFVYSICLYSLAGNDFVLMNRRMSEAYMYLEGVYEAYNDNSDGTYPDTYRYVYLDGNGGRSVNTIHGFDAADPIPVVTEFSSVPRGKYASGEVYNLTFAGWYTEEVGGTKVDLLDGSLKNGAVIYAHWQDALGRTITVPKGDPIEPLKVYTTDDANIRSGPGTFYDKINRVGKGEELVITETFVRGSLTWGKFDGGWTSLSNTDYFERIWPKNGTVTGNSVRVRSGPSTDYSVQYKLNEGARVTIHEQQKGGSYYWGRLDDGNWIAMTYVELDKYEPELPVVPDIEIGEPSFRGDVDGSGAIDIDDVVTLLLYVSMPDLFDIAADGDLDSNGTTDVDDVVSLLLHVSMPDLFPI